MAITEVVLVGFFDHGFSPGTGSVSRHGNKASATDAVLKNVIF